MESIPRENLKTVVDEAYTAFGGLGPDISRLVAGTSSLSIDARKNLGPLLTLIDQSKPVLDTQTDTPDAVQAWAAHLADITRGLKTNDPAVQGVLQQGGPAAGEVRQLFDRLSPDTARLARQPGQRRAGRGDLSARPRAASGAAAAGGGHSPGDRRAEPEHQAGLQGRVLELQPATQPTAAVHHRLSAAPAAAGAFLRGLPGAPRAATCIAGCRRTRR